jgi:putative membrane protein (TIGR04086 family)
MFQWMKGISAGLMSTAALLLLFTIVLSTLLRFTPLTENDLGFLPTLLSAAALIVGGVFTGVKSRTKGWLAGGLTGFFFSLLIIFFRIVFSHHLPNLNQIVFYLMAIGLMSLGGIFGVNLSVRKGN